MASYIRISQTGADPGLPPSGTAYLWLDALNVWHINYDDGSSAEIPGTITAPPLTDGNIFVGDATNTAVDVSMTGAIAINNTGVTSYVGTVPVNKGGTGQTTAITGFNALAPTTTKGDLVVHNGTNNIREPVGTNDSVLLADSTQASGLRYAAMLGSVGVTVDGGGSVITTGQKGYVTVPYAGTITGWDLIADQSGSVVFDVWKVANAVPTIANTITAAAKPTLTASQQIESTNLTAWTTSVAAGDVFGFNIDSVSTITRVTLTLRVRKK